MAKLHAFGAVLARLRQEQGFATSYAFYHARDGKKTLGLTYRNYLRLEQGLNLPKPEKLEAIMQALGIAGRDNAKTLIEAYFASLGLDRLAKALAAPQSAAGREDWKLGELAARHVIREKAAHLSPEQWKLRADDFDAHVCLIYLVNAPGGADYEELSKMCGLTVEAAKRAAKKLAAAKLVKISGNLVRTPLEDKHVQAIPKIPAMVGAAAALDKHRERLIERSALLQNSVVAERLPESSLKHFQSHLDDLTDMTTLYRSPAKTPDSEVYLIRSQIFKLFPQKRPR